MLKIIAPTKNSMPVWANAFFLLGLVLFNLTDSLTIVLGYFLETIVIGVLHALKLAMTVKFGKADPPRYNQMPGYMLVPFFIVHYGMFVAIQTLFLFSIVSIDNSSLSSGFELFKNINYALHLKGMGWVLTSIILTNCFYFYFNFLKTKRYLEVAPSQLFFKPYIRIVIQQFTVILCGFFIVFLSGAKAAAILLIVIRWFTDSVMFAIRSDSKSLDYLAKKLTKKGASISKTKEQLQQLSE
jgi:hypothetical protein